ncbi:MAG: hypothetical protein ACP5MZ_02565 [Candidatus Micrarchaeia archaeon]
MDTLLYNKRYVSDMHSLANRVGEIAIAVSSFAKYFDGCKADIRNDALNMISEFSGKIAYARSDILNLEKRMRKLEDSNSTRLESIKSVLHKDHGSSDAKNLSDAVSIEMPKLYGSFISDLDLFVDYIDERIALFGKLLSVTKMNAEMRSKMIKDEEAEVEKHIFGNGFPSLADTKSAFNAFVRAFGLGVGENIPLQCISGYSPYGRTRFFQTERVGTNMPTEESLSVLDRYGDDPAILLFLKLVDSARPVAVSIYYNHDAALDGLLRYAEINYISRHTIYGRVSADNRDTRELEDDIRRHMFSRFYHQVTELMGKGAGVTVKSYEDKGAVEVSIQRVPIPDAAKAKMLVMEIIDSFETKGNEL